MAYIGKSPTGTGVRQRYYFTATGGETSLSGTDDNGLTLSFSDGVYVDVSLNGISLVAGDDYNTTTANTIGGLTALAANDVVEIVVYDIFTVADTVSAKDGGTFSGNVNINGDLDINGNDLILDADADSKIEASTDDTINIISGGNTAISIDSSGIVSHSKPVIMSGQIGSQMTHPDADTDGAMALKFNDFFVNKGGITHSTTNGKFTLPVDGVYHVTFAGFKFHNVAPMRLFIGHETATPTATTHRGHAYISDSTNYQMFTLSTIIDCDANDFIVFYLADGKLYNTTTDRFNQFTIAKIA